jgi:protein phosphatase PTC1
LDALRKAPSDHIPDVLNQTFHIVDSNLTKLSEQSEGKMHSGCTAVTAFLRLEDAQGRQSFLPSDYDALGIIQDIIEASGEDGQEASGGESPERTKSNSSDSKQTKASKLKNAIRSIGTSSHSRRASQGSSSPTISSRELKSQQIYTPSPDLNVRRVLYCANAGDARGVLCRAGKAVRLTYDHKGTDKQEAKRIMDAGGFVMSGRVNGVLAVTRSLGDSSMKEFVVGAPYTTETDLSEDDEFMIMACDGVSSLCHNRYDATLLTILLALGCSR